MNNKKIGVIDIGTTSCKGALINEDGLILKKYSILNNDKASTSRITEFNPFEMLEKIKTIILNLAESNNIDYISFSTIGESLVLLDIDDKLFTNSLMYLDNR